MHQWEPPMFSMENTKAKPPPAGFIPDLEALISGVYGSMERSAEREPTCPLCRTEGEPLPPWFLRNTAFSRQVESHLRWHFRVSTNRTARAAAKAFCRIQGFESWAIFGAEVSLSAAMHIKLSRERSYWGGIKSQFDVVSSVLSVTMRDWAQDPLIPIWKLEVKAKGPGISTFSAAVMRREFRELVEETARSAETLAQAATLVRDVFAGMREALTQQQQ